jgi:muramoyltetrapeptide carboxypeptidase
MLTSLLQSGALDGVIGIALGVFTNAEPGADGVSVQDVLTECLSGLRVPIVSGVPAGHVDDNLELPLGSEVVLDASTGSLRFEELIAGR